MKHLFYLVLIFSFFELSAQTEKDFILKTSIGYNYNHNYDRDISESSGYGEKINDLKFSLTSGKKLKSHFYYGLGLSYNAIKKELNPDSDVPMLSSSQSYFGASSYYNSISTSNVISPIIYLQYYTKLNERIYFTIDLYSKYDFYITKTESALYFPDLTNYNYDKVDGYESEMKKQYFNIGIFPSLRINIYKNFGMDFTFGSVAYRIKTADSSINIDKKTKEFEIEFKPENWIIGFYLEI